jgi:hypothetical protein
LVVLAAAVERACEVTGEKVGDPAAVWVAVAVAACAAAVPAVAG